MTMTQPNRNDFIKALPDQIQGDFKKFQSRYDEDLDILKEYQGQNSKEIDRVQSLSGEGVTDEGKRERISTRLNELYEEYDEKITMHEKDMLKAKDSLRDRAMKERERIKPAAVDDSTYNRYEGSVKSELTVLKSVVKEKGSLMREIDDLLNRFKHNETKLDILYSHRHIVMDIADSLDERGYLVGQVNARIESVFNEVFPGRQALNDLINYLDSQSVGKPGTRRQLQHILASEMKKI